MKVLILCLVLMWGGGEGAKILGMFHLPIKSHHILGDVLLGALADKGHDVTMITPYADDGGRKGYRTIGLDGVLDQKQGLLTLMANFQDMYLIQRTLALNVELSKLNDLVLNHAVIRNLIVSNETFDLIIYSYAGNEAFLGLSHVFKSPSVILTTIGANFATDILTGNPAPSSYVPNFFSGYSGKMSMLERVTNLAFNLAAESTIYLFHRPNQNAAYSQIFPEAPTLEEMIRNVSLVLHNSHLSIEPARPSVPMTVNVGGFHVVKPKPIIPNDLKDFLDGAKEGAVYVSFGSNLEVGPEKRAAILDSIGSLPVKVVWKTDLEVPDNVSGKVKTGKWMPQNDILAHPNVKAFVTHGGMLSTIEAVYHGVPLLGIPLFGDQEMNVKGSERQGFAVHHPYQELTQESLKKAVIEVINNPRYRQSAAYHSKLLKDQPLKPIDTAVFWIEYVLRHKGAHHLKTEAMNLSVFEYYYLDVLFYVLAIGVAAASLSVLLFFMFGGHRALFRYVVHKIKVD